MSNENRSRGSDRPIPFRLDESLFQRPVAEEELAAFDGTGGYDPVRFVGRELSASDREKVERTIDRLDIDPDLKPFYGSDSDQTTGMRQIESPIGTEFRRRDRRPPMIVLLKTPLGRFNGLQPRERLAHHRTSDDELASRALGKESPPTLQLPLIHQLQTRALELLVEGPIRIGQAHLHLPLLRLGDIGHRCKSMTPSYGPLLEVHNPSPPPPTHSYLSTLHDRFFHHFFLPLFRSSTRWRRLGRTLACRQLYKATPLRLGTFLKQAFELSRHLCRSMARALLLFGVPRLHTGKQRKK